MEHFNIAFTNHKRTLEEIPILYWAIDSQSCSERNIAG